jgi:hypothetical protein
MTLDDCEAALARIRGLPPPFLDYRPPTEEALAAALALCVACEYRGPHPQLVGRSLRGGVTVRFGSTDLPADPKVFATVLNRGVLRVSFSARMRGRTPRSSLSRDYPLTAGGLTTFLDDARRHLAGEDLTRDVR